ncbi:fasciclin-like arabinogalactan protein 17 [Physcomitrium patens]|uniref:FAS1 domain-containing protein n=1 Tax=Physcomitrium patens TaxID=3218 RepID=A0A2K1J7R5_PHYPA|nr:fasciclin-like arabinogalactan protein 17 [Physcomitrium patens]PNR37564.1 hypothetical protein PHYPA_020673 [Physcomitrium patens]|eukprot:XP_024397894.1 fasciclin-like arabinogalactan protein 17 [Physcomitrella patens]
MGSRGMAAVGYLGEGGGGIAAAAMDWRWRKIGVLSMLMLVWCGGVEGFDAGVGSNKVIGLREVRLGTGSVLQALLDSQYSEMVLYLDKADMLEELEREVLRQKAITLFAPKNSHLEQLDADLGRFLMRPGHEEYLRTVLRYHVIPGRVEGADFQNRTVETLSKGDVVGLRTYGLKRYVGLLRVFSPNSIVRKDGIVHGVDGLMVPPKVASAFEEWKRNGKSGVNPHGSPVTLKRSRKSSAGAKSAPKARYMLERSAPAVPAALIHAVTAPAPPATAPSLGPSLGPSIAPAPGPGTAMFNWDDEDEMLQFVTALSNYGGYNDMAELLVNATTLGVELGKLARMGYKLTILAPNDQAMQLLTTEQLNQAMEPLLYYHFLSEYQTEESMYNAVKRLGKQSYSTLRHPHKVVASESDGTVKFGDGDDAAHIFDHDIYVDGHISIQGINRVLTPPP